MKIVKQPARGKDRLGVSVPPCLGFFLRIFGRPRGKPDSSMVEVGVLHLGGPEKVMIVCS